MQLARTFAVPTVNCVWPIAQINVAGRSLANVSAMRLTCASGSGDALNLVRRPLVDLVADLVEAVDTLPNEFLVLQPFWKICQSIP